MCEEVRCLKCKARLLDLHNNNLTIEESIVEVEMPLPECDIILKCYRCGCILEMNLIYVGAEKVGFAKDVGKISAICHKNSR